MVRLWHLLCSADSDKLYSIDQHNWDATLQVSASSLQAYAFAPSRYEEANFAVIYPESCVQHLFRTTLCIALLSLCIVSVTAPENSCHMQPGQVHEYTCILVYCWHG